MTEVSQYRSENIFERETVFDLDYLASESKPDGPLANNDFEKLVSKVFRVEV